MPLVLPIIFALSGFSGLIYESLWTHYLKLFLGHAAYAQSLVLAIFMGGMAAGAWAAARISAGRRDPLRDYAIVEMLVGLAALGFHGVFVASTDFAFDTLLPLSGGGWAAATIRWGLAGALILPQSVLLGMTFPLMAAGVLRRFPAPAGGLLAGLYVANSLGGVVGVLAAGFVMIDRLGLPGTMAAAGLLNLLVAALILPAAGPRPVAGADAGPAKASALPAGALLLVTAFLTGATSFAYEIGWIRLLGMVLGASTHSFEVMLAAFIAGLALGGALIRKRIDRLMRPILVLAGAQIAMGLLAAATIPAAGGAFHAMRWLMAALPRSEAGYWLYNAGGMGLALAVMLPATVCAGMTLPLISVILLRAGGGERSIGAVYGANTLGAIAGVAVSLHLLMPAVGIEGLVIGGGAADILVGLVLLGLAGVASPARLAAGGAVALAGLAAVGLALPLDQALLASGVYRHGKLPEAGGAWVESHRDGKTASIHIVRDNAGVVSIRTNGKADAAIAMGSGAAPVADEATMVMLGALPLLLRPEARTIANIGFGAGLTTHVMLAAPGIERVDTIEIEPFMVELARAFLPRNARAYGDARSQMHFDDAKSFFARRPGRYDVIVSEPSNPWVSGVSGLFSIEFYDLARRQLTPGGLLVQWLPLHELEPALVASVLKAVAAAFGDYVVYAANGGDSVVVAANGAPIGVPSAKALGDPALASELARVGIGGMADLAMRRIGDHRSWGPLMETYPLPANSDYHPVLDQGAARSRFLGRHASSLSVLRSEPLPVAEMLMGAEVAAVAGDVTPNPIFMVSRPFFKARLLRDRLAGRPADPGNPLAVELEPEVVRLLQTCAGGLGRRDPVFALLEVARATLAYLPPAEAGAVVGRLRDLPCGAGAAAGDGRWLVLLEAIGARRADAMADIAEGLLASGVPLTPARRRFLLATGLLGHVAGGNGSAARALWRAHGSPADLAGGGLLFPLLDALAGQQ